MLKSKAKSGILKKKLKICIPKTKQHIGDENGRF